MSGRKRGGRAFVSDRQNPLVIHSRAAMIARMKSRVFSCLLMGCAAMAHGQLLVQDDFQGKLGKGWSWLREDPSNWRTGANGLEIRILPGNMWGPANDAKNILLHPVPEGGRAAAEVAVTVENHPTGQYEQVDLVWYYDDSHMVKLGEELVDGQLSIVMGREENDRTRTITIIPLHVNKVRLRLQVRGHQITGHFRLPNSEEWHRAGECDLPVKGPPRISLQTYQGVPGAEHWARLTNFRLRRLEKE